jgi:glucose/arabinose dehydrogenase
MYHSDLFIKEIDGNCVLLMFCSILSLLVILILITHNIPLILPVALAQPSLHRPELQAEVVFQGLDFPTSMAFLGPNDILVLEKENGTVQRVLNGQMSSEPVLDVGVASKGERGMLGIATSGIETVNKQPYVFLFYTESATNTDGDDLVSEPVGNRVYRYSLDNGYLKDGELLLDLPAELTTNVTPYHNGGTVLVGPDESIYTVIGDLSTRRTQSQNFQDGPPPDDTSVIIRIDKEGNPVEGNPFEGVDNTRKYYAYGIRNSFGLDIDPVSGKLWNTENGPDYGDEINLVEPGFNSGALIVYGMSSVQKDFDPNKLVNFDGKGEYSDPEFVWNTPIGVTAIQFLDSEKYGKEYENDMLVGDVNNGNIYHFDLNIERTGLLLEGKLKDKIADNPREAEEVVFGKGFGGIMDMDMGPDGYLYILAITKFKDDNTGTIYRIVPISETSQG